MTTASTGHAIDVLRRAGVDPSTFVFRRKYADDVLFHRVVDVLGLVASRLSDCERQLDDALGLAKGATAAAAKATAEAAEAALIATALMGSPSPEMVEQLKEIRDGG